MKNLITRIGLTILLVVFGLAGCDQSDQLVGTSPSTISPLQKGGRGGRGGHSETWINKELGGVVSGSATYNCALSIAPNSIPKSDTYTLDTYKDGGLQYGYAEFLPHTNFTKPAKIYLDYAYYGLNDNEAQTINVYWYNPIPGTWDLVNVPKTVSKTSKTVSFYTDHISIYAFGR